MRVPYNRPAVTGREIDFIREALETRHLSGDGPFSKRCEAWLEARIGGTARLTHSCTAALEMAAILADVGPGDEVIMPSFTFVSTANAFVLRGATPVFIDIRPDTLNIDPALIEAAITPRTKVIVAVHYAGVCAEMDAIQNIADRHGLMIIEDAAQALLSSYFDRPAGSLSTISCFSFHETKNLVSGEGGAILINDPKLVERADIIREKGTNRTAFRKRTVDKYTWVDIGSSYLPAEIIAAHLWAQFEAGDDTTTMRMNIWNRYHQGFQSAELKECVVRPTVPQHCSHNGHIYYLLLKSKIARDGLIVSLAEDGILAPFHYIPLHSAPAGLRYGRTSGELVHTDATSDRLIRLPLFRDLGDDQEIVIDRVLSHIGSA
ncbi:dTDP-4-amino-4,6-dideoxygalactose transaminase [Bosea sp. PAMC 26642]|uniref:dTDP-4-amino-4,6-dideoxygalactose transaminase n=1 Tax=Bosea sp. (strain PAMC 26642) TaxID=1792307 RepID=UPI0007701E63|nr:dTDP-4-amino-4,6-dideoxygalactose transaminase [Bosea sp. PAMC 26642]AMJ62707.1 dTDP-4-amino-4,6-dideoxygalactose transaminase [Bosea sp. PAMC 26642]